MRKQEKKGETPRQCNQNTATLERLPEVHCNQPDNLQSQVMTSHGRVRSRPSPPRRRRRRLHPRERAGVAVGRSTLTEGGRGGRGMKGERAERVNHCLGEGRRVRAHLRCSGGHPPERSGSHSLGRRPPRRRRRGAGVAGGAEWAYVCGGWWSP